MATNDDAAACKRWAVSLGYWQDRFLPLLTGTRTAVRRAPEISRGYFARVCGVQLLVEQVLRSQDQGQLQLLLLGAGSDSLYWRLRAAGASFRAFVELDLAPVVARKIRAIRKQQELLELFNVQDEEVVIQPTSLHTADYHLMAFDLAKHENWPDVLHACHLSSTAPTIVIAECVLVYVPAEPISHLLRVISQSFSHAIFINYEMLNINDRFGDVLMSNMQDRGCELPGFAACASPDTQIERFVSSGWAGCQVWDMNRVMASLPASQLQHMQQLELMDEHHLLEQLLGHYGISVAWTSPCQQLAQSIGFD